jgi:uroporphyrinogen-III decarboxylase
MDHMNAYERVVGGRDGGLMVSGGCIIPDICPPENIQAMVETAKTWE